MKAIRYHGRKDFRLERVSEPDPDSNEVKIKVYVCGICGSDVHDYIAGPLVSKVQKPHPQTGKLPPVIGGHEFTGEVVATGCDVNRVAIGDRVVVRPTMPCYQCHYCQQGHYIQCSVLATLGVSADGAFAEYVVVREDCVYKLPANVSYEIGAYAEPLACGIHAIQRCHLESSTTVAVIGAGPIGLLTMQAVLAYGVEAVHVFETVSSRRELALQLGATSVFDPFTDDPGKAIASVTNGLRADIVFECAGTCASLLLANTISGRGKTIAGMGVITEPCSFPFLDLFMREKTIIMCQGYLNVEFETAISYLAEDKVKTDPLMTSASISLDEIVSRGFNELIGPERTSHCKILVFP